MEEVLPLPRDGGNQAPQFVRFGFHVGGMYNLTTNIGGASQAPARFTRGFFASNWGESLETSLCEQAFETAARELLDKPSRTGVAGVRSPPLWGLSSLQLVS